MTDLTQAELREPGVTQADRDAAWPFMDVIDWDGPEKLRAGVFDRDDMIQAFAAHAARDRAGMIAFLRARAACPGKCSKCNDHRAMADAFERGEDKKPQKTP